MNKKVNENGLMANDPSSPTAADSSGEAHEASSNTRDAQTEKAGGSSRAAHLLGYINGVPTITVPKGERLMWFVESESQAEALYNSMHPDSREVLQVTIRPKGLSDTYQLYPQEV